MALLEVAVDQVVAGSDRPVVNVFHVDTTEGMFAQAAADAIKGCWQARIRQAQHSGVTGQRVRVRSMDGVAFGESTLGTAGANTSAGHAPNVAVLVRKITPGIARRRYGRMFLAGGTEADIDQGGNLSTTAVTNWQGHLNGFLLDLKAAGVRMVQPVWLGVGGTAPGATLYEVTSLIVQSKVATQKRRLRK